jgi:hypothetical protein
MKVKDLINFLQTLNQENELLFADYYYDSREGFIPWNNNAKIELYIVSPKKTEYNKNYPEDVYLVDLNYYP